MMVIPSEQAAKRYSRCTIIPKAELFIQVSAIPGTEDTDLRSRKLLPT